MKKIYISILIFTSIVSFSQSENDIKLLEQKLFTIKVDDSIKMQTLYQLANIYVNTEPKKGLDYIKKSIEVAKKINNRNFIFQGNGLLGAIYLNMSDFENAMVCYNSLLKMAKNDKEKGRVLKNIGLIYSLKNNYPKALETELKAYKLSS